MVKCRSFFSTAHLHSQTFLMKIIKHTCVQCVVTYRLIYFGSNILNQINDSKKQFQDVSHCFDATLPSEGEVPVSSTCPVGVLIL